MNPEQKAALIEEIAALVAQGSDNAYAVLSARAKVKEVLARAMPEPDGDAVELAAKAMWDYERQHTDWEPWEELLKNYGKNGIKGQAHYRDMARAALAAAGSDADWLDEALDSVHPKAVISVHGFNENGDHIIYIRWPDKHGVFNAKGDNEAAGIGATRRAAVLAAVAAAKKETSHD